MNGAEVIQKIVDKKMAQTYLEIGVADGASFFPIRARRKIAVDPHFTFSRMNKIQWSLKNLYNMTAMYYESTSNSFFASAKLPHGLDVIFIDGQHTYRQSLKDVNNSLNSLNEDGVIIMHDCNPPHEAAAYPADYPPLAVSPNIPGWTGEWCGDVWKTICHLKSQRQDLKIFVLDCDYGLGIITKGIADDCLNLTEKEVDDLTYDDLARNRRTLLNLKDESFLTEFLNTI